MRHGWRRVLTGGPSRVGTHRAAGRPEPGRAVQCLPASQSARTPPTRDRPDGGRGRSATGSSPRTQQLARSSRRLDRIAHDSSLPVAALLVGGALICSVAVGAVLGFPAGWLTGFEVGTAVVTLMMVFLIRHTQSRNMRPPSASSTSCCGSSPGGGRVREAGGGLGGGVARRGEMGQRESKGAPAGDYTWTMTDRRSDPGGH